MGESVNGVSVGNNNVGCYCLCQGEERERERVNEDFCLYSETRSNVGD